jgi:dephospho-CoA kinase
MSYCVGLTGNIASGKTTAANIFRKLGVLVIEADKIAKELTEVQSPVFKEIVRHFGSKVLDVHGEINRRYLRSLIFSQPKERLWLEHLLHPLIRQRIKEAVAQCKQPYCVVEIPLGIDKINYPYLNEILLITAAKETQIARVMARDHCLAEEAEAILAIQPHVNERLDSAEEVLVNEGSIEELTLDIESLHQKYLKQCSLGE